MSKLSVKKTAFTLGALFGLMHLVWALLVAFGIAKGLYDWILGLHFISLQWNVMPFDVVTALLLIIVTAIIGAITGAVLAWLWNGLHVDHDV
ncbi:MAG: hypothetical protein V1722_01200 [Candidatus Micrarchaeota archaeon]